MSDNSDYKPLPGHTPLKLPPKPEPVAPAAAPAPAPVAAEPATPPVVAAPTPPPIAFAPAPVAPAPAPVAHTPAPAPVAPKPLATLAARPLATHAPAANKLPTTPKFVSPMPKIDEADQAIPAYLPVIAGLAAAVALTFTVLLYLKR